MRALLYARTSAADLGQSPEARYGPMLRDVAARRAWQADEIFDRDPRHDGPRPNLEEGLARCARGEIDVLVVPALSHAVRSLGGLAALLSRLQGLGVAVVALEECLDTTTPAGSATHGEVLRLLRVVGHDLRSEAIKVGNIIRRAKASGHPIERPRVPINLLELRALFERGEAGKLLSLDTIGHRLGVSKHTVINRLRELRESGAALDLNARRQLTVNRGGRRRKAITFDLNELTALRRRGLGAARILRSATSLPKGTSEWAIKQLLRTKIDPAIAAA